MRNDWIEIHYLYADMAAIIDLFRFYNIQISPPQDVSFAKKIMTIYCFFVDSSFRVFATESSHIYMNI